MYVPTAVRSRQSGLASVRAAVSGTRLRKSEYHQTQARCVATSAAATVRRTLRNGESRAVSLSEITAVDEPRMDMHDAELNRVLGGGLVPGSIVLLGGEPGIGKSTLTLQTILRMPERKILYVSGEESAHQ